MGPTFTPEAVAGLMPGVQQTVTKHMARWAQQRGFEAYPSVRLLTFDVLVNQALGLGMDDAEIASFSAVGPWSPCSLPRHQQLWAGTSCFVVDPTISSCRLWKFVVCILLCACHVCSQCASGGSPCRTACAAPASSTCCSCMYNAVRYSATEFTIDKNVAC
jgi:hypothetical protein